MRVVGRTIDAVLQSRDLLRAETLAGPGREATLSILNGMPGDHPHASGNPLAIPMSLACARL